MTDTGSPAGVAGRCGYVQIDRMMAPLALATLIAPLTLQPAGAYQEAPPAREPPVAPVEAAPAAGAEPAAAPAVVPPEALAPPLRPGRMVLQVAAAAPAHLAATALVLGAACSGDVVKVRCGKGLEGSGGALAATGIALALLPPLASGSIVYGLGGTDDHTPSFFWTVGAGVAAQGLGFGLAMWTGEPAIGVLSLSLMPVAAEMVAARLTLERDAPLPPGPIPAREAGGAGHRLPSLVVVPVASGTF